MFQKIMVPIDLEHRDILGPALKCAADLARVYGGEQHYVGVTSSAPSAVGHTPTEYEGRLKTFSETQATERRAAEGAQDLDHPCPLEALEGGLRDREAHSRSLGGSRSARREGSLVPRLQLGQRAPKEAEMARGRLSDVPRGFLAGLQSPAGSICQSRRP